jgi:hypothetical protein
MNEEPETDDAEETASRRTRDPELRAIEEMVRALEKLDPNARRAALAYLVDRFGRVPSVIVRESAP